MGAKPQRRRLAIEEEVFLSIQRAAGGLMRGVEAALKPYGLSANQYNVLRILRGAGREGLACRQIAGRMLSRDPDITRLLDRLEGRKLVARSRGREDRRVITARITEAGLALLAKLDAPVARAHRRQLGGLGGGRLQTLNELLEAARAGIP